MGGRFDDRIRGDRGSPPPFVPHQRWSRISVAEARWERRYRLALDSLYTVGLVAVATLVAAIAGVW